VRILSDGTRLSDSPAAHYRDSQGRIRIEHPVARFSNDPVVEIEDPVAGYTWVLDPVNLVAHRLPLKSMSRAASETVRPCPTSGNSLGMKTIQGIPACGTKSAVKDTVFENWLAAGDAGGLLRSSISESNGSTSISEMTGIKFTEPDPALFEPLAGYKVQEESGAFTMTGGGPAIAQPPALPRTVTALTGMPFSADLLSGAKPLNHYYRDSMGRTRREPVAPVTAATEIIDTVAGFRYTLDPSKQVAHRQAVTVRSKEAAAASPPPAIATNTSRLAGGITGLNEWLGTKTIDGIEAWGSRVTLTYPPGTLGGNDKTFSAVTEAWNSPKLGLPVLMNNSGPLTGATGTTLGNIRYNEPDPSLFQVPAGYTVVDDN
jgi:hypothetical protein